MDRSRGRFSLFTILSLGVIVLGIGFIAWAMINILSQPDYSISPEYLQEVITAAESEHNTVASVSEKPLYPIIADENDRIGILTIPALMLELPIFNGTSSAVLKKGVGHLSTTVLPGEEGNSVLSGHRDTVFKRLNELKIGDQLIVRTQAGTFIYEISRTRIVAKDDKTVTMPTNHAVLTITTCYPFIYIGDAPERYIIIADMKATQN